MHNFEHSVQIDAKQARYYQLLSDKLLNNKLLNNKLANKPLATNDSPALAAELGHTPTRPNHKPIAHFYGGNGFVVGAYAPLLTQLSRYFNLVSLAMPGYWYELPTAKVLTREQDADFLIEFLLSTQTGPVIGIGHSQGATATAIAAAKRPDLFSSLYLLDPVTFTKAQKIVYERIPRPLLMTQEPFKSTKVKQAHWDNVDAYYQHLRKLSALRRISDAHLQVFAKNSLLPQNNAGYTLLFKPEQELASYFGTPYIDTALRRLNRLSLPYQLILGKPSLFNSAKVRQNWQKFIPSTHITTLMGYGHLLPLEAPKLCADIIGQQAQSQNQP